MTQSTEDWTRQSGEIRQHIVDFEEDLTGGSHKNGEERDSTLRGTLSDQLQESGLATVEIVAVSIRGMLDSLLYGKRVPHSTIRITIHDLNQQGSTGGFLLDNAQVMESSIIRDQGGQQDLINISFSSAAAGDRGVNLHHSPAKS